MGTSGGSAAAAGFRYQHLVTVEALLDKFYEEPGGNWVIGVDLRGQDSADYVVLDAPEVPPLVAVQVKSSMATSSTQMTAPDVLSMLSRLGFEHPDALRYEIHTNRRLSEPARAIADALATGAAVAGLADIVTGRCHIRSNPTENVETMAERLRARVTEYRVGVNAEVAGNIALLVVSRLRDLVDEKAMALKDQFITAPMIAEVMRLPGQQLAQASGGRQYGRMLGFPAGDFISRAGMEAFLDNHFPTAGGGEGVPSVAVVTGASGVGKSSGVAAWARRHSERYFCLIWMAAGSSELLEGQVPLLIEHLGEPISSETPSAQALGEALRRIPFPWLIIFDDAPDPRLISAWLPASGYGDVVVTSKNSTWPPSAAPSLRMDSLGIDEARELIARRLTGRLAATEADFDLMRRLAETMGFWPLAIDTACHWIARRGGSIDNLETYIRRLDTIDLNDDLSIPLGYPRSAVAAIVATWEDLSDPAKCVLTLALLCGGQDVPIEILSTAYESSPDLSAQVAFEVERVLDELLSSSLARRFLRDSCEPDSAIDDRIAIEDAVSLVARGRLHYPASYLFQLKDALHEQLVRLRDDVRLRAAASYLPAAGGLLTAAIGTFESHEAQRFFAPMMQDVGVIMMLTGSPQRAALWLGHAVEHYAIDATGAEQPRLILVNHLLVAAAQLAQALLRTGRGEAVGPVLETVVNAVEHCRELLDNDIAQAALGELAELFPHVSANHDLARRLHLLQHSNFSPYRGQGATPFANWSIGLADSTDRAVRLMNAERWGEGMDTFLSAANMARDKGALQYEIVETGISVGLALVVSLFSRGLSEPPATWNEAWTRYSEWYTSLEDIMAHQQIRLNILLSAGDPTLPFPSPVSTEGVADRIGPLDAEEWRKWDQLAADIAATHRGKLWYVPGEDLANGSITLVRTINGGTDVKVWIFGSPFRLPGVAFVNVSAVANSGGGWTDPQPKRMQSAGFPEYDPVRGELMVADGWMARFHRESLSVVDRNSVPWLMADLADWVDPDWLRWARRARYIHLMYADLGGATEEAIRNYPHQAAIRLRRRLWKSPFRWFRAPE